MDFVVVTQVLITIALWELMKWLVEKVTHKRATAEIQGGGTISVAVKRWDKFNVRSYLDRVLRDTELAQKE